MPHGLTRCPHNRGEAKNLAALVQKVKVGITFSKNVAFLHVFGLSNYKPTTKLQPAMRDKAVRKMKFRQLKFQVKVAIAFTFLFIGLNVRAAGEQESALKDFLQNRPPISKIVFLFTDFTNGTISTSCLYEGGWNKEGFYLKRFAIRSANVDSHSSLITNFQSFLAVGKEGSKYWHMTENHDLTQTELQNQTDPASNAISAHALNLKIRLDQTLNLGIKLLKEGALQWSGDAFTGEYEDGIVRLKKVTYQEHGKKKTVEHPQIYGQAVRENGQITSIKISDYLPEIGPTYLLSYQYNSSNPLPKNLPNVILMECFVGKFHKTEPVEGIEILSIEFSDTNSPTLAYSINNYVESTNSYSLIFSNNQYYTFSSNGSPQLLNLANSNPPSGGEIKLKKFIVIGFMVLTSVGLFLFFLAKVPKTKTTTRSKMNRI